ncbi:hypothetical protein M0805_006915 [Coniferiporia weirii]|nr:hypothetical protein M0805_006915 [Coniferiporia weirii]
MVRTDGRLFPERDKFVMAQCVAIIEHMHQHGVMHRDIKSENILIDAAGLDVIFVFRAGTVQMLSMSKDSEGSSTTGGLKGTLRFTPVELINMNLDRELNVHSKASDIWAFGMTILVLLTKKRPYSHLSSDFLVIVAIMRGELPPIPEDYETWSGHYKDLWKLCARCWNLAPLERPTVSDVSSILRSFSGRAEAGETEIVDHYTSLVSSKESPEGLSSVSNVLP